MAALSSERKNAEKCKIPNPTLTANEPPKIRISDDTAIEIERNLHYNKLR